MAKFLKEQRIISFSPEANAYRNLHRKKVDRLFKIKRKSTGEKKKKFDRLARQQWRKIVIKANEL